MFTFFAHAAADIGKQRTALEDCVRVEHLPQGGVIAIVCDGMGGVVGGALAAREAVRALAEHFRAQTTAANMEAVRQGLLVANEAVAAVARQTQQSGMGTTGVVAWCEGTTCHVGWVGDSRMYCWRGGQLITRTTDHSVVEALIARGELSPEAAAGDPRAHKLSQALGTGQAVKPSVHRGLQLAQGDVILLCSDGLYDCIPDDELFQFVAGRSYAEAVPALIEEANARGGHDNIGVALVVVGARQIPSGGKA